MYRDPVRLGIVFKEEDYKLSSCYYKGKVDIIGQIPVSEVSADLFQEEEIEI